LSLKAIGGYNTNWSDGTLWQRAYWKYTPNGRINKGYINAPNALQLQSGYKRYYSGRIQAGYSNSVGDNNFDLLLGSSAQDQTTENTSTKRLNIAGNNLPALNLGSSSDIKNDWSAGEWSLASGFMRFRYNYEEKYLLEASFRADASSRFSKANRWAFFPSFSLGWRIIKEKFMQHQNIFSSLKLKASYGEVGNQNGLGLYDYIPIFSITNSFIPFPNSLEQQAFNPRLASPERTWETIISKNIGMEMGFLRDKLIVKANYFVKRNKDMLIGIKVPSIIGITVPTNNNGSLKTKGWEISADWQSRNGNDGFNYNIEINLSDRTNKITNLGQASNTPTAGFNNIQGYPANSVFAYQANGYFQNKKEVNNSAFQNANTSLGDIKYVDQNGDGKITSPEDLIFAGTTNPRYNFGLNLGVSYKGFNLSLFFQGVGKRNYYLSSTSVGTYLHPWVSWSYKFQDDYWTPENRQALFPRPYLGGGFNYQFSTHWVQNAAYIRLKNLRLGYKLPSSLLQDIKINSIEVYFSGLNLWTATNLLAFDPEVGSTTASNVYPLNESYSLGLNITF
jgi:TonB-linked SusC/RagA family outer membrane protein